MMVADSYYSYGIRYLVVGGGDPTLNPKTLGPEPLQKTSVQPQSRPPPSPKSQNPEPLVKWNCSGLGDVSGGIASVPG